MNGIWDSGTSDIDTNCLCVGMLFFQPHTARQTRHLTDSAKLGQLRTLVESTCQNRTLRV